MAKPMNWTPDQLKAIDARGGTLIVSAAAGSGKTAVLVERCIRRLTDTEHPCSADRLLIVTFTRAAAAELKDSEDAFKACADKVESLQNTLSGYEYRYQNRSAKLNSAKEALDKQTLDVEEKQRRVRLLEEMERNLEGFQSSVRAVIKQAERGALQGILGPVSRLIQADAEYALAIETALGAAAQNLTFAGHIIVAANAFDHDALFLDFH